MSQILLLFIISMFIQFLVYEYILRKCDEGYFLSLIKITQIERQQQLFLKNLRQIQNFPYSNNLQNYFYNNCNYENRNYNTISTIYSANNYNTINSQYQINNAKYIYKTPIKKTQNYYNNYIMDRNN